MDFKEDDFKNGFLEKSHFEILYAKHLEEIILERYKSIKRVLSEKKLRLKIDKDRRLVKVSTTSRTRDPYVILKGRDYVSFICKGVPCNEAEKLFDENVSHIIINMNTLVSNKNVLINRRNRLIGPNGDSLKALKMLTNTYIYVTTKAVCVIGAYSNVLKVEEFVTKVMQNYHPVHLLKQMSIRKEIELTEDKKDMSWKNFIPDVKKKIGTRKSNKKTFNTRKGKLFMDEPVRNEDIKIMTQNKQIHPSP